MLQLSLHPSYTHKAMPICKPATLHSKLPLRRSMELPLRRGRECRRQAGGRESLGLECGRVERLVNDMLHRLCLRLPNADCPAMTTPHTRHRAVALLRCVHHQHKRRRHPARQRDAITHQAPRIGEQQVVRLGPTTDARKICLGSARARGT